MRHLSIIFLLLCIFTAVISCSSDSDGKATFRVRLTDSPADYDHVYIDIREVRVHTSGSAGEEDGGWTTLDNINAGIYDLLELTGGIDTVLATAELPAGRISQVRLILGDENSVVIEGISYDLRTPSAQQSGLKLNVQAELTPDITYDLLLDFDAARSIVRTGNGRYILKPVIRATPLSQGGSICGMVSPLDASLVVYAIQGSDSTGTFTDENGKFCLQGLEEGTYTISIVPNDDYVSALRENVGVTNGQVTDIGSIVLTE